MRSKPPAFLPFLRSQHLAEMMAYVLMHPDQEFSLTDLARELDMPLTTVQTECNRMVEAGVVHTRKVGRTRLITTNKDNPAVRPLTELLSMTYGPRAVIEEEFSEVHGVERVIIFGSWAARFHGVYGPPPNDIDVLVIGEGVSQMESFDAADRAQQVVKTTVNPVLCTPAQWENPEKDMLLVQIKQAPFVEAFHADGTITR